MKPKTRVVFMGTPDFAVPALEKLVLDCYEVVAVYTQPDKKVGRGRLLVSSPVKRAALTLGLPVVQTASLKIPEVVMQIAKFHPDVIVVVAFGQILPKQVLDIPRYGCINIHPSLLPRFRGASPVAAAVLAGDEFTGVTIMLMDEGLDTGPVLTRAQIPISARDTTGSLTSKLSWIAAHMLQDGLVRWLRGELTPQPQNEAEATYCGPISKSEGEIDWHMPVVDAWRRVRAFYPWPGCYTTWQGRRLKITKAVPLPEKESFEIGRVVVTPTTENMEVGFGVYCGGGILGIRRVQLEGKTAVPAVEFLRGQRQFIGSVLPS